MKIRIIKNIYLRIIRRSLTMLLLTIQLFSTTRLWSAETCSRVAIINNQEILVDSNSSEKGEGLRYHLEKDPVAKDYLDTYQKNSGLYWPNALLGTLGTGALLYGFFDNDTQEKDIFLITGASIIFVNFLMAKTFEYTNETNLNRAIEEYNKRNLPRIYFSPEENRGQIDFFQYKVGLLKSWSF